MEYVQKATDIYWELSSQVDFNKQSLQIALISILFNPTFWNITARLEYKTHFLTKAFLNKPKIACYFLAATIFSLGILRDNLYHQALLDQPTSSLLSTDEVKYAGIAFFVFGNILVLSSMWVLGVTGTYLGDYFGILMTDRVTGFPFNVTNNPMYHGSTLCFLGTALYFAKPAGLFTTVFVYLMYEIALFFEEPFTAMIYAKRDEKLQKSQ